MTARTRIFVIAGAAAAVAAGATVALAVITSSDPGGQGKSAERLPGAPPLVLELGVRVDPEARALRKAQGLLPKDRPAAGRIFARYRSPEAQLGAALAAWPDSSLATIERLAEERPRDSLVLLHLGYAKFWVGRQDEAAAAWRKAAQAQPDSAYAQRANDALHRDFPAGQPIFVPSFPAPQGLNQLAPPAQLAFLARAARRDDPRAKLFYGIALQGLGHRISATRQYDAAARLAPRNPDAQVAAAVVRFEKSRPAAAFSRLGPLTRRFPHAATVRFHLGLLLLWMAKTQPGSVQEGKRQLRLARAEDPHSRLGREAKQLLDGLENVRAR